MLCRRNLISMGLTMVGGISALPRQASACLVPLCFDDEPEFHPNCTVVVRHRKRPICGATIRVSSDSQELSFRTDSSGSAELRNLAPGRYGIHVQHLGISAANQCFKIADGPSPTATKRKIYQWGDSPIEMEKVSVLLRDLHRQEQKTVQPRFAFTPVQDMRVSLHCAFSGDVLIAATNALGRSDFGYVPESLYVLSIQGGAGANHEVFPHCAAVLRVHSRYRDNGIIFTRKLGSIDSCGEQVVLIESVDIGDSRANWTPKGRVRSSCDHGDATAVAQKEIG